VGKLWRVDKALEGSEGLVGKAPRPLRTRACSAGVGLSCYQERKMAVR
jgi:hypothetical protein